MQSITAQIKQVLLDKERLRKRTQLKRTSYRIIGKRKQTNTNNNNNTNAKAADTHLNDHDEEIFDDSDFYQQILKEVVEMGGQGKGSKKKTEIVECMINSFFFVLDAAVGVLPAEVLERKRMKKPKTNVDRRASKGRKIR